MKKSIYLLLLAVLPLTACGSTENIDKDEAVQKTLPALAKNTVDTYNESGCMTIEANLTSFQADVTSEDYSVSASLSGAVTLGLRNMYTTDASQLQVAGVFKDCNISVSYKMKDDAEATKYEIKDFSIGVYLSAGNLYVDISNESLMDSIASITAEVSGGKVDASVIKTLLGKGKFKVDNVVTNDMLPIVTKEEITEEAIAEGINEVFGLVNQDDLANIMKLVHDKKENTYDLSFDVKDPAIINRAIEDNTKDISSSMPVDVKNICTAVDAHVEAWTNENGVFSGAKLNGNTTFAEEGVTTKLAAEGNLSFDFTKYGITNPSFSEFKSANAIIEFIKNLLGNYIGENGLEGLSFNF